MVLKFKFLTNNVAFSSTISVSLGLSLVASISFLGIILSLGLENVSSGAHSTNKIGRIFSFKKSSNYIKALFLEKFKSFYIHNLTQIKRISIEIYISYRSKSTSCFSRFSKFYQTSGTIWRHYNSL